MLGIMASAISGNLFAPSGAYDSIASTTLSTAASTITFSSIPSGYTHLQIRGIARNSAAADDIRLGFNSDTGSNYNFHVMRGSGTAATSTWGSGTYIELGVIVYSGQTANVFAGFIVDVLDYGNTSKFKTLRVLNPADINGSGYVTYSSGLWRSTSAVSSITLSVGGGGNYTQYSSFALYGIKGA
jgi:hypothetical protein